MQGVLRLKPQTPKYDDIWDPGIILNYFSLKGPNEGFYLEIFSKKTPSLFALVTAH